MKIILLGLLLVSILSACVPGESTGYPLFSYGPVVEVEAPTAYKKDSISKFIIRYSRPNTCYLFNGFYYLPEGNTRTVAIEYAYLNSSNCQIEANPTYEVPLNFKPENSGNYLFKFWTGEDPEGVDQFIEIEAVVP